MAQRTTFAKLQRERAKKQRAEEKRARKEGRPSPAAQNTYTPPPARTLGVPDVEGDGRPLHPNELLRLVEQLTAAHDAGLIDDDELEDKRSKLMARI